MNILITSAYTVDGETGSASVAKLLAHELSKNHKVMYLCLGSKLEKVKVTKNLIYLKMPSSNINDIWVPVMSPKTINRIYEELDHFKPEVIHSQNIIFGGLLSLIWAKERNVPYVSTFHYIPTEGLAYVFPKLKEDKLMSELNFHLSSSHIKAFLTHIDFVIALNSVIVKSLKKIDPKTPYTIIGNGIQLKNYKNLAINAPKGKVNFVYPGSYTQRKNQEHLIKAFRYLPQNYCLNFYGNKKSGFFYVKKLEDLIKKYKIRNARINNYKSESEMLKVYENSHYLVSASTKEVQSLVIIEALASGKPIIALENETTKELINGRNGLLISQKTPPKIFAEKLKSYVESTNKNYFEVSNNSRQSVSEFDIEKVSQKIVSVYKKVLKEKKASSKKIKSNEFESIQELIPEPLKGIFNELLAKTQNRKKINSLKFFLAVSSVVGGLGMVIASIFKLAKIPSKIYSYFRKSLS